jgi:addiction module HigA family antidote
MKNKLPPIHPGKHIEQGLEVLGLSNAEAARILGCSRAFIGDLVRGKRDLSMEMCFKISGLLGSTPEFWAALQNQYDLKIAERDTSLLNAVRKIRQNVKSHYPVHA